MSKTGRDDFSKPTIDALAKRAGFLCSNPDCRRPTIGSNEVSNKSTSIGQAAHITAACEGGPRYNNDLKADQRSDISNGIWLCSNCSTLIDKDPEHYTITLLQEWKECVEKESRSKLSSGFKIEKNQSKNVFDNGPFLEADLIGEGRTRFNTGNSMKNPIEMHNGQLVMVPGSKPIIHWALTWYYKLMIFNNSNFPAFNVKVEEVGKVRFSNIEQLSKINNIAPLENKELKVEYDDRIEGVHSAADALLNPRYPERFNEDVVLKIIYYDQTRNEHISLVYFENGEIINKKLSGANSSGFK